MEGFFWHFYKSNGNLPSSAPAEVAWAGGSLWCASDSWDSPTLCACAHIQHFQIEGKIHLLKAGMQGLHSSVMSALIESFKSGLRRDPQSIFEGAALIPEVPIPVGSEKGAHFSTTPRTQPGTVEGTQVALHFWAPLPTLPSRTNHIIKFVHSSWPRTRCMLFRISYFFGLLVSLNQKRLWVQWLEINWIYLPSRYLSSDLAVTEILQNAVFCSTFQYETWGTMILWFQLSAREDSNYTPHNRSAVKLLCNYSVTKLYLIYLYSEVHLELAIRARTWLNTYLHQSQYI